MNTTVSDGGGVLAVVEDLYFSSMIESTASRLGISCRLASGTEAALDSARQAAPALLLLDLNNRLSSPLELLRRWKEDDRLSSIPVLGFVSHVQLELQESARKAGCDRILPRSAFRASLPEILASAGV